MTTLGDYAQLVLGSIVSERDPLAAQGEGGLLAESKLARVQAARAYCARYLCETALRMAVSNRPPAPCADCPATARGKLSA